MLLLVVEFEKYLNSESEDEDLFDGLAWLEKFYGVRLPKIALKKGDWNVKDVSEMTQEDWTKFFSKDKKILF